MGGVGGAQITILTSGKVCLYQNVPADQAHAITVLLSHGNSPCDEYRKGTLMQNTDQPTAKTNTFNTVGDEVEFRSSTSPCPSPHRITQVEMNQQQQQQQRVIGRSQAELPIARRASVERRLEKRKERVHASMAVKACEKMDDRSERIAGQVREIVNSERLPVPFSEMDPLVLKTLRSYYRNNKPTPPCPRSRCANTAFRSLNVCSKTLLLKPVFYCKSCKHKFTLNGSLRTPPIRRQAAPDHSSPPSFSSTPWGAEQQLQAVGQITTHNREHGKQLEQQQQQAGAEQDLMLEDEAVHNIDLTNTSTCAAADGREYAANGYMAEWEEFLLHCADNE